MYKTCRSLFPDITLNNNKTSLAYLAYTEIWNVISKCTTLGVSILHTQNNCTWITVIISFPKFLIWRRETEILHSGILVFFKTNRLLFSLFIIQSGLCSNPHTDCPAFAVDMGANDAGHVGTQYCLLRTKGPEKNGSFSSEKKENKSSSKPIKELPLELFYIF